jgi:hypothetical protein
MGDFFPGGWQQNFGLFKHDAGTYRKFAWKQPENRSGAR